MPFHQNLGFDGILNNAIRGIIPSVSGWDTSPDQLQNVTDGDVNTSSGTGTTTTIGSANLGFLTIDLGSIQTLMFGCRFGIWSNAGTIYIYYSSSDDNINFRTNIGSIYYKSSAAEAIGDSHSFICTGRYVRFQFFVSAAAIGNVNIYEISAWRLKL